MGTVDCEGFGSMTECENFECSWSGEECLEPSATGPGGGEPVDCEDLSQDDCRDESTCEWSNGECLDIEVLMRQWTPADAEAFRLILLIFLTTGVLTFAGTLTIWY